MSIADHYEEIARCNKCGFCQVACPVFRTTGRETGVARGRLSLLRAIIEERINWGPELKDVLFDCLRCGACSANCFPAVATADLITGARSEYLDKVGRSTIHRVLFDRLLPYPGRLRMAAKAVALGKNTGLSQVARALGMLRIFGKNLSQAEDLVEHVPMRAYREKVRPGVVQGSGKALRIGYFVGCGLDIMWPKIAAATVELLCRIGKTVCVLDNSCCGLPAETYGDHRVAQRLAEQNLDAIHVDNFDIIVTDCSSCANFLKQYPDLFPKHDARRKQAEDLAARVRDVLEVTGQVQSVPREAEAPIVATFHYPCHASRGQGLMAEPREILSAVPGLEYRELPEADWCCGAAGAYAISHYDISMKVLDRKMDNIEKTGAELVVTSCPACIMQLCYGVRQRNLPIRVRHISEVVGRLG